MKQEIVRATVRVQRILKGKRKVDRSLLSRVGDTKEQAVKNLEIELLELKNQCKIFEIVSGISLTPATREVFEGHSIITDQIFVTPLEILSKESLNV